jgi:hypothetical protein
VQLWIQIRQAQLRARAQQLRERPDAGYSTETAIVTALLVLLAIAVIALLTAKIMAKVEQIDLG